ncbi:putative pyrroloquinoline-quinone binding quinoprotein [Streptomyces sp. Ag109_G2-6]|uniref:outer membrane protein assembly factor BamB family protein n=1 Tax=Streptomyces TaxID=1883 RepID=UPI0009A4F7F6|nr:MULTISPECIES: PQQ-binding-like beta-propeller repeat protein [Streptomyces]RPF43909.1 putative pyrroloquinoline-quinone binding quinoprotein [Streptomyces sp. Ag109_G2-6]
MDNGSSFGARLWAGARLVAACALTAVAVLYAVLCVKLVAVDMTEVVCSAGGCPRGLGWLLLWAFAAVAGASLLWWAVLRGRAYRSAALWAVAVFLSPAALLPAWQGFEWLRGPHLTLFGYQVPEGPAAGRPLGAWEEHGSGSVIRVRTDGVSAYDGEGRHGWGIAAPPDGAAVCGMSEETPARTGLLVYGRGGVCGSRLVAVDLASGRQLWAQDVPDPSGTVSAGGSLVLTAPGGTVVARDLATGTERWRSPLPEGATATGLRAGPDRVLVTARSAPGGSELLALDPATGAPAWRASLPAGAEPATIVSAAPAAAVIAGGRLLVFDARGGQHTEGSPYVPSADGRRIRLGDVLVVAVPEREEREVLAGFSLTDGRLLWRRPLGDDWSVRTLGAAAGGRVAVVSRGPYSHLWDLDPRTGTATAEPAVLRVRDLPMGDRTVLYGRTFVNLDPGGALPPVFDLGPVLGW